MGRPLPPLLRGGAPQAGWIGASGASILGGARTKTPAPTAGGGRARERSRRPTGSGGIGKCAARKAGEHPGGSPREDARPNSGGEAERERAHAGRRGPGASESAPPAKRASILGGARAKTPAPTAGGGRARARSRRPTGSGGIGKCAARKAGEHPGRSPREDARPNSGGEAERESAHAGRRGLGASEQRSAQRARAADGPPESIDPCEAGGYLRRGNLHISGNTHWRQPPEFPSISRT